MFKNANSNELFSRQCELQAPVKLWCGAHAHYIIQQRYSVAKWWFYTTDNYIFGFGVFCAVVKNNSGLFLSKASEHGCNFNSSFAF